MIKNFKHRGLKLLYDGNQKGVNAEHVRKLKQILALLDAAQTIDALDLPNLGLHRLGGDRKGTWAVKVPWKLASDVRVRGWRS